MLWKIAGLVIALGILVFTIYYAVIMPTQAPCWNDIQYEFNKQLNFPLSKWGNTEFYVAAIMDSSCIREIAFTDGESGCRAVCDGLEGSSDKQKCRELCNERCRENPDSGKTGDCVVLVPVKRSWSDVPQFWRWISEAPWNTIRKIYHSVTIYPAGAYNLDGNPPLVPESGENRIYCLKFGLDENNYRVNEIGIVENTKDRSSGEYRRRCREDEIS